MKVIISGCGAIDPAAKIFAEVGANVLIFSNIERDDLLTKHSNVEIVVSPMIDAAFVVTELDKRGVNGLLVEGGVSVLEMFLSSGLVDALRVARNPEVVVGDVDAPHFDVEQFVCAADIARREVLGGVEVTHYKKFGGSSRVLSDEDTELLARAVEVSRRSPAKDSCYRVGAVVKSVKGDIFEGYTLEDSPTHHAEQAAIDKALRAGADLRGATMYASMEPCSQRRSEPESCSAILLRLGFSRVLFAVYEPSHFVVCRGAENLRRAGVEVHCLREFAAEVLQINSHLF